MSTAWIISMIININSYHPLFSLLFALWAEFSFKEISIL